MPDLKTSQETAKVSSDLHASGTEEYLRFIKETPSGSGIFEDFKLMFKQLGDWMYTYLGIAAITPVSKRLVLKITQAGGSDPSNDDTVLNQLVTGTITPSYENTGIYKIDLQNAVLQDGKALGSTKYIVSDAGDEITLIVVKIVSTTRARIFVYSISPATGTATLTNGLLTNEVILIAELFN